MSSEHRSTHGVTRAAQGELRRAPLELRRGLWHLSDAIGAQPNQRVKLPAPHLWVWCIRKCSVIQLPV